MDCSDDAGTHQAELAVFDLDGTCMDGQSGLLVSTYLYKRGLLGVVDIVRLAWWGARYKIHLPHRQQEAREIIFSALCRRCKDEGEIVDIMRAFHDEVMVARYRPEALAELARRRDEGKVVLLASATFHELAACAAERFGVQGFIATEMERDEAGAYTGRVEGTVIEGKEKLRAVVSWADEHLGPGRWVLSCAYGDHHSDAALLAASREPFAVCPGKTLKSLARKRGWTILEWSDVA